MSPRSLFAVLTLVLLLAACQTAPPLSREEKLANAFCECTTKLVPLNQQAMALQKDTNQAKINAVFEQLQNEYTASKECLAAAIAQYGKLKPENYPVVEQYLKQHCPGLAGNPELLHDMLGE